jgi:hypothetical protein
MVLDKLAVEDVATVREQGEPARHIADLANNVLETGSG